MIRFSILSVLVVSVLWIAALFGYVQYIGSLDAKGRRGIATASADSIIVLTGGAQRIQVGKELLEARAAPKMFITGVGAGARLGRILPNLPKRLNCCVFLGRKAGDTQGNAREVQQWLCGTAGQRGTDQRVILVTAHYHLPRALWYFSALMPEGTWLPYAVEPDALLLKDWYLNPLGWQLLSMELMKFLAAVLS